MIRRNHLPFPSLGPIALLVSILALAGSAVMADDDPSQAKTPEEMKPYIEKIPGTNFTFEMVPIPGGTYKIGSPEDEEDREDNEGPQREITIRPFWMGKYEMTWDVYDEFAYSLDIKRKTREGVDLAQQSESEMEADAVTRPTPPYADMTFGFGHDKQPALCMTHHAAMQFTDWLSAKTGKLYRLPTEAEWEYACRAGTTTAYWFGSDPEKLDEHEWYVMNAEQPMPIGTKKPNPWGLYDMHGNVAEWCLDHYIEDIYSTYSEDKPTVSPVALPDEKEYSYVIRGGSWDDDVESCRSAVRRGSEKDWSMQDPQRPQSIWWHTEAIHVGLRVIRPFEEQEDLVGLKSKVVSKKDVK